VIDRHRRTARDDRLDELALRVSRVVDGESNEDVACVFALLLARAVHDGYRPSIRKKAMDRMIEFARAMMSYGEH